MKTKSILIVDDEQIIQRPIKEALVQHGYNVTTADNGKKALNIIENNTFNLILLDILMPVMDGATFLKEFRAKYPNSITKIIVLTNVADQDKWDDAEHDIDAFLVKVDWKIKQLVEKVDSILSE